MLHAKTPFAAALVSILAAGTTATLAEPLGDHPRAAERVDMRLERMAERLDLTDAQQQQIRAILEKQHAAADAERLEGRKRIDAVLTPEQRALRDEQRESRMERRLDRMAERLDLSDAQREELRAILAERRSNPELSRAELRERMAAVLTPEQIAQLDTPRERQGRERCGDRDGAPSRQR